MLHTGGMLHQTPLITTIVFGIGLAFVFGAIANRLRLPPIIGYLVAGIIVGPATPGYTADLELASELAEIGVILLMFGVGLHFSLKDLLSVKHIAVPGAFVQIAIATLMGMALAYGMGWNLGAGLVFGLALSVASTIVLLRALQERKLVETERGRIAVGWLIVEDLAMVLTLVLLPAISGLLTGNAPNGQSIILTLSMTLGKVAAFIGFMLLVGRRVIPWILHGIAHTGSRELFRLAVLSIALGVAYGAAELFGVSFALGAFFAGMMLSESELSQQAAEESLPLRDAFAVLFFVSVGMLFDPMILIEQPLPVLATLFIIVVGKSLAALLIVRSYRYSLHTALTISVSLAQIGEFSFILAALGVSLGMLPQEGQDLILAGALLSIMLNSFCFRLLDRFKPKKKKAEPPKEEAPILAPDEPLIPTRLTQHAVVIGSGRIGGLIAKKLEALSIPFLVIEEEWERVAPLRERNVEVLFGNGVDGKLLDAANLAVAKWLFIAVPHAFEAGQIVQKTRVLNKDLNIVVRAQSDAEAEYLRAQGASIIITGEREIALGMVSRAFGES